MDNYYIPSIQLSEKKDITRDEFWWVGLVLLFVLWAYSQYTLNRAIESCKSSGGLEQVDGGILGIGWKVKCYQKP